MVTAAEEFKRNPDLKEEDLKHVKDWLSKQPHLPQNIPDEMIILLMHSCYYSIEQSKQFIDTYYTLRTHLPEFFNNREVHKQDLLDVHQTINVFPLEGITEEGYKVIIGGFHRKDPQYFNFSDTFKLLFMVADAAVRVEGTAPGMILMVDFSGMRLGHLARLSLPVMKKILTYVQEGMPVRLKGLHFINIVPFIDKVVAMMKPFMKKELMDMLELHSEGSDTMYKHVPQHILPNEYGGSAGKIEDLREKTHKLLKDHLEWYREDEKVRVDEKKRPGKAKSAGDIFGLEGSFRKLTID